MGTPLLVVAGVIAIGLFFVVLPVVLGTYARVRQRKVVTCPETHDMTEVTLESGRAALMSAFGRTALRVKSCDLWPKKQGCAEACVKENWPQV